MSLEDSLAKMSLKDGDIIFFDTGAIDHSLLAALCTNHPASLPSIVFIGVCLRFGQTVEDVVFSMSKTELDLLTADKANG